MNTNPSPTEVHRTSPENGKRKRRSTLSVLVLASLLLAANANFLHARSDTVPQQVPITDPLFDQRIAVQLNLNAALFIEMSQTPRFPEVQVFIADTGVDSSHPDLVGQVRDDLSKNVFGDDTGGFPDPNGHGTGMAGYAVARTNSGGFVASPAGYGGYVKAAWARWNNSVVGDPQKARDALQFAYDKNFSGEAHIVSICFASGIPDDNRKATKQLALKLQSQEVVILGPGHGMIGALASDPDIHNIVTVSSLNEAGDGFDPLSGSEIDAMFALPGGVLHQLLPVNFPTGVGSGWLTTGGVSAAIAMASGCFAAACQWGHAQHPLEVLDAFKQTARQFPAGIGHVLGVMDLYGAMTYDPNAPAVTDVVYGLDAPNRLVIKGRNFGSTPRAFLNGVEVTEFVKNLGNEKKLKLKGDIQSHLHAGSNEVRVMTGDGGSLSNLFVFSL